MDIAKMRASSQLLPPPGGDVVCECLDEIDRLRNVVKELAKLAQHADNCAWATPLPTGEGYWGCDCGLDHLVFDGEPTEAALTPNEVVKPRR